MRAPERVPDAGGRARRGHPGRDLRRDQGRRSTGPVPAGSTSSPAPGPATEHPPPGADPGPGTARTSAEHTADTRGNRHDRHQAARERRRPDPRAGRGEGRPPRRRGTTPAAAAGDPDKPAARRTQPAGAAGHPRGEADRDPVARAGSRSSSGRGPRTRPTTCRSSPAAWRSSASSSIFPALIALLSLYGLVATPETVARQVEDLSAQLPESAAQIIEEQLNAIVANSGSALTVGLIVSILAALWSASGGVGNLVTAVNLAYDEVEARNFVKLKLMSLGLVLGSIVFVLITFGLVAVVPAVLDALPLGVVGTILAQVVRWVLLLAVFAGALAVLYRVAPDRDAPRFSWVSLGAVVVTVVWAIVSVGFSLYVDNFGSYDKTYGAIAGVIVLMLWLYLTCYLVLLGRGDQLRGRAPDRARHHRGRAAADGRPRREDGRLAARPAGRRRRSAPAAPDPGVAQRTWDSTNGGLHHLAPTGAARGRRRRARRPSCDAGGGVDQGQRDPGAQARGERAAGDLADPLARGVEHGHARARDAPAGRRAAPTAPGRGPASFSASSASRPQNAGFFQPTAQPARACIGRDLQRQLLPVQRVAHLGAQRVPGAQAAGPDAEVLPGLQHGVPQLRPPGRPRPAARSRARRCSRCGRPSPRHAAVRRSRSRTTCSPARRAARGAPAPAATCGPCTARTATSVVLVGDRRPRPARLGQPARAPRRRWRRSGRATPRRARAGRRSGRRRRHRPAGRRRSTACTAPGRGRCAPGRWSGSESTNAAAPGPADGRRCPGGRRRRRRRRSRTAVCSASTPPPAYSMGISQPPKSASLAPAATCRSWRGEVSGLTEATVVAAPFRGPAPSLRGAGEQRGPLLDRTVPPTITATATAREADRRRRRRRRRQGTRRAAARPGRRGGRRRSAAGCSPRWPTSARRGAEDEVTRLATFGQGPSRSSPSPASARPSRRRATAPRRCAGPPAPPAARSAGAARS